LGLLVDQQPKYSKQDESLSKACKTLINKKVLEANFIPAIGA
jgi:hypothetical protein